MEKQKIYKIIITILSCIITCVGIAFGMQSCTTQRVINTETKYINTRDSAVTITCKTTETYTARKKNK